MNINNLKAAEAPGKYNVIGDLSAEEIITLAQKLAATKLKKGAVINSPKAVFDYLNVIFSTNENEVFAMLHLDSQHRVIELEVLFKGTINESAVYPREVVKSVLSKNSATVLLCHNHPSGIAEPSESDKSLTKTLQNALNLIGVNILDHVIVGTENTVSFAQRGLI